MVQVRVGADDYREFRAAAGRAGVDVEQWLAGAGREKARATATDLDGIWQDVCAELDNPVLLEARVLSSLRATRPLAIVEGVLLLEAPDRHARDLVEIRLRVAVEKVLSRRLRCPVQVAITVAGAVEGFSRAATSAAVTSAAATSAPVDAAVTPVTATSAAMDAIVAATSAAVDAATAAAARQRPDLTAAYAELIAQPDVARRLAEVLVAAGQLRPS
ncbi:hypothetical protein [Actinoplanes palleronii]|uniref:DUF721 domain-containing protein n=1 Tax=Actinoplanes palleronii TaxID=113570 RepID=A0ABQ4BH46_9ACTN|nr:hypothetical protein [Actinoplanes palleronii]GIE70006.1 hypothetical protein Apa02nite_061140 [Actinoplanes palleronii]